MVLKRVAILTNFPADGASFSGGVETVTSYLLEGLEKCGAGMEFHIISLSKAIGRDRHLEKNGFRFHFLAVKTHPLMRPHFPYNIVRCLVMLRKIKPDLVHCQDNVALALAAAIGGYPRVFTVHGVRRIEAKLWKGRTYWSHQVDRVLEWLVQKNYKNFIAVSPYVENLLGRAKRVFCVANPVSDHFFAAGTGPAGPREKGILFIGSLIHLKQVHVLVQAFALIKREFRDARLLICGRRDDRRYYERLVRTIADQALSDVEFVSHLTERELIARLAQASVLVLPSIQENCPMTIAEAMAAGTPVVAARVGGIPYMIEHRRTGMLFSAGDAGALASCISELFVNEKLALEIRRNARLKARDRYRCSDIAQRHIAVYSEIMAGGE